MNMTARNSWITVVLLLLAISAAVAIRLASFQNFINPEGGFFFYSVDAYDHLRRITLGVHSFPSISAFDFYAGYPKGTGQLWSPLFDYVLSGVSLLFGGSRSAIETVSFFSNPFFAALTVLLIFAIARKAFSSDVAGIAAAFLLAMSPAHISCSIPMNFDHHVLEPVAVLFLFGLPRFEKNDRLTSKGRLSAAFLLVLAIFMWRGSTIYWGAACIAVFIRSLVSGNKMLSFDYAVSFILASLAIALICMVDPWGSASSVSFGIISWFHVIVLLLLASILLLFAFIETKRSFTYVMVCLAGAGMLSLFVPQVRDFFSGIMRGITFLSGTGDPWLEANSELHGVFFKYDFFYSASYLTAAWFAAPFGSAYALGNWKKSTMADKWLITLVVWSPLVLLGLIVRYTPIAAVMSSLLGAYLIASAWQRTRDFRNRALVATGVALLMLLSFQHYEVNLTLKLPPYLKDGLYGKTGALEWIKNNTPTTSYYLEPTRQPEYGILANWDLGAKIYYLAERPALATAFGSETHGLYEQAGFMATARPDIAYSIVRDNRIRYILLTAFTSRKSQYAIALDGEAKGKMLKGTVAAFEPVASMYSKLMYGDGSAQGTGDSYLRALGNYRLVFETDYLAERKEREPPLSYFKIFEAVPGAVIRGQGKPDTRVFIRIPLMTSLKRMLLFQDAAMTDKEGSFAFTVPYATEGKQGETVPMGQYTISGSGIRDLRVKVTETEVAEGLTVRVSERRH